MANPNQDSPILTDVYRGSFSLDSICNPLTELVHTSKPEISSGEIEASLEAFIKIHFHEIIGSKAIHIVSNRPIHIVSNRPIQSEPDIIAIDELGRVHLIEVKKEKIGRNDVLQAEQYMLRCIFTDKESLFDEWGEGSKDTEEVLREKEILGIWANKDPENVKDKRKMNHEEFRNKLLELSNKRYGIELNSSQLAKCTESYSRKQPFKTPGFSFPISIPTLVLWVIAPKINEDAIERINELRCRGIDIRMAKCELLQDKKNKSLWIRISKELNKEREALESKTLEICKEINKPKPKITWNLYAQIAPSNRTSKKTAFWGMTSEISGNKYFGQYCLFCQKMGWSVSKANKWREKCISKMMDYDWTHSVDLLCLPNKMNHDEVPGTNGRYGIELFGLPKNWTPGIFIGFVIDPSDHGINVSDPELGIDISLILDLYIERERIKSFVNSNEYGALVQRLTEQKSKYIITDISKKYKPNLWHPLHIRYPLYKLIEPIPEETAQIDATIDFAENIIREIAKGDELKSYFKNI